MLRTLLALLILAAPVAAQTNDPFFASWRWNEETPAPRAAGLAGAFVGLADDASAVMLNPAGMVRLPKIEIAASLLGRASGGPADALRSRTGFGYIGGSGLVSRRWAIGGYVSVPHDRHMLLVVPAGGAPAGFLDTTITDGGGALSWQPSDRLSLGLRINVTHLRLQADVISGATDPVFIGMAAGANRVTGDAGLLFDVTPAVKLGVIYRRGASWRVERIARRVSPSSVIDTQPFELRAPSLVSGGFSYRANEHLLLTGQGDLLLFDSGSPLRVTQGASAATDYNRESNFNLRGGAEVSWNTGGISLQVRGGIAREAPGALVFSGTDAVEAGLFLGQDPITFGTAGASVVAAAGAGAELGVHVAATLGGERTVFSGGVSLRF